MSALLKFQTLAIEQDQAPPPRPVLNILADDITPLPDVVYIDHFNWLGNPLLLANAEFERYKKIIYRHFEIEQGKRDFINQRNQSDYELKCEILSCTQNQTIPPFLINYDKQRKVIKRTFKKIAKTPRYEREYVIRQGIKKPYIIQSVYDDRAFEVKLAEHTEKLVKRGELPPDYYRRLILRQLAQGKAIPLQTLAENDIVFFYRYQYPHIVPFGEPRPEPVTVSRLQREQRQPQGVSDFVLIDHNDWQQYANMQRLYDKLPPHLPLAKTKKEPSNIYIDKEKVSDYAYFTPNRKGLKNYIHCVVFDLDPIDKNCGDLFSQNFFKWQDAGLPPPNLIIANPHKHGSYQLIYHLSAPIRTSERYPCLRQMDWLNRIVKRMATLLGADIGFNGGRSKNPFSSEHDVYVSGAEPYTLQQLSDQCDLVAWEQEQAEIARNAPKSTSKPSKSGLGINVPSKGIYGYIDPVRAKNDQHFKGKGVFVEEFYWQLGQNGRAFESIRHKAYKKAYLTPHDLELFILNEYNEFQANFTKPMPLCDIRASVKSILKFCIRVFGEGNGTLDDEFKQKLKKSSELYSEHARQLFSIKQRNRVNVRWQGYDDKKAQALAMLKDGVKQADICQELQVSKMTLSRWKKGSNIR